MVPCVAVASPLVKVYALFEQIVALPPAVALGNGSTVNRNTIAYDLTSL
jgi:hypothetical protein